MWKRIVDRVSRPMALVGLLALGGCYNIDPVGANEGQGFVCSDNSENMCPKGFTCTVVRSPSDACEKRCKKDGTAPSLACTALADGGAIPIGDMMTPPDNNKAPEISDFTTTLNPQTGILSISLTATDPNGQVDLVECYNNDSFVARPAKKGDSYSLTINTLATDNPQPNGTIYKISCRARDNGGKVAASPTRNVTVDNCIWFQRADMTKYGPKPPSAGQNAACPDLMSRGQPNEDCTWARQPISEACASMDCGGNCR